MEHQTHNTSQHLNAGDLAPNATLQRADGECVTLAELFRDKRTLLVFLRHFG